MKTKFLWLLMLIGTGYRAAAQTDSLGRPVYLGLDVLQNAQALFPLLNGQGLYRSYANVEPTLLVASNKPRRYWRVTLGYTAFASERTYRNIFLDDRGVYLKTGFEYTRQWFGTGWALTGHAWQSRDRFIFTGSYFGDYTGNMVDQSQVALGMEGYLRQYARLGGRFGLRFIERLNVLAPLQSNPGNTFIPGVGLVTRGTVKVGGGASIQLLFRLQPKEAPRRFAVNQRFQ